MSTLAASRIFATSPKGAQLEFRGGGLTVRRRKGTAGRNFDVHQSTTGGSVIVGIIPEDWAIRMEFHDCTRRVHIGGV